MNHFEYRDGALHCEQVALETIAAEIGTPVYVYSTATLERHFDVFVEAFAPRRPLVAYAVKANSNIAVLATLAKRGAGADTVSAGEIHRALKAGIPPARIVFSGVGKTEDELKFAITQSLHSINVESPAELETLETLARELNARPDVVIRINPNIAGGAHHKISTGRGDDKFGVSIDQALQLYAAKSDSPHLALRGLAAHVGSQIRDLTPLQRTFELMRDLARQLRGQGIAIDRLDLGGGLGAPYFNEPDPPPPTEYAAVINRVFGGFDIELAFEPGRMIAANAGVLLTRVIRVQSRPQRDIIVLDAAMNDLLRPAMYESFHDLKPVREPDRDAERTPRDLVGPICETSDTFARARDLHALAPGEIAAFMTAGAYGATMSSTYNTRALVPEVLVRGDRFELIRRRFEVADQIALERLPDWLA